MHVIVLKVRQAVLDAKQEMQQQLRGEGAVGNDTSAGRDWSDDGIGLSGLLSLVRIPSRPLTSPRTRAIVVWDTIVAKGLFYRYCASDFW